MTKLFQSEREAILDTCHRALPIVEAISDMFYGRLFSLCPEYRPLFPDDPRERQQHLIAQLARAVAAAEADDPFVLDAASACVQRPQPEGVRACADESLLWALEQALGSGFGEPQQRAFLLLCGG